MIISKEVLDTITDATRPVANVTQWCKKEDCWTRVKNLPISLNQELESILVDFDEIKTEVRRARKEQKVIAGIEAQTQVINYGAEYWVSLSKFVLSKKLASPSELDALSIACKIPKKLPNSVHSQNLLMLVERAEAEGWKAV
jgi:hypothetical protein